MAVMTQAIPEKDWQWFGHPGHFIGGDACRFHLTTQVGGFLVSTVGEYRPHSYTGKVQEVGAGYLYETLVFSLGQHSLCSCCEKPEPNSWAEIDSLCCNDSITARRNHLMLCRKYASTEQQHKIKVERLQAIGGGR